MLLKLWDDECGAIDAAAHILLMTIFVLGCLVGMSALRTNVVQEFGDLANSVESLNQSYSYTINGVTSSYSDGPAPATNSPGTAPTGLNVVVAASPTE
jgi:hypothetical protein